MRNNAFSIPISKVLHFAPTNSVSMFATDYLVFGSIHN
jgi:hypothetical protein